METVPKFSPAGERGEGKEGPCQETTTSDRTKPTFAIAEAEVTSCARIADRILARVLADLATMRQIAVQAVSTSMCDEARAVAQLDIERLKRDISKLTEMFSRLPIDELGMSEAEYAKSMASIERSIEETAGIMEKPLGMRKADAGLQSAGEAALSKWFDGIMKRVDFEEKGN